MSIFYPPDQTRVFLVLFIFGVVVGFVYDAFRIKRCLFGCSSLVLFLDDLVFSIVSVIAFLFIVFWSNNGIVRWYEFFFTLLGFYFYLITVSRLLFLPVLSILNLVLSLLLNALRYLLFPIKQTGRFAVFLLQPFVCCFYKKLVVNKMIKNNFVRM